MQIVWSLQAKRDIVEITSHISKDKKEAALRWARSVEKKVARLRHFPKSGRAVPEVGREEIREILVGSYRIIYKLEKTVSVLTVFHGAKKPLAL